MALCAIVLAPTASAGTYRVKPGDTLSAIAARDRTTVAALARLNHLSIAGPLLAGTLLELPSRPLPPCATASPPVTA